MDAVPLSFERTHQDLEPLHFTLSPWMSPCSGLQAYIETMVFVRQGHLLIEAAHPFTRPFTLLQVVTNGKRLAGRNSCLHTYIGYPMGHAVPRLGSPCPKTTFWARRTSRHSQVHSLVGTHRSGCLAYSMTLARLRGRTLRLKWKRHVINLTPETVKPGGCYRGISAAMSSVQDLLDICLEFRTTSLLQPVALMSQAYSGVAELPEYSGKFPSNSSIS